MAAKANGSGNGDCARRLRSRFREPQIRIFDCPQRLTALLVIETSRVRHVEAACRALDQPHSDLTLERRNAAADRRLGHAKQACGSCETARFDDTSEHHDIVEIKHLCSELGQSFPIIGHYGSMWTSLTCSSEKQEEQSHELQTKRSGHRRYRPAGRRGCARTAVQGTSRQGADPQAG